MSDKWRKALKPAIMGGTVGIVVGLAGFFLLTSWHPGMGDALFLLVPISAGFTIALITRGDTGATAAGILAVLSPLVLLIAFGMEGLLCATLALPLISAGLSIGLGIGMFVRRFLDARSDHQTTTVGILLLLGPALIFTTDALERPLLERPRIEIVRDSVTVNAPPEKVWKNILSIDNVKASKPLLMYVGLPIPERCALKGSGIGAKRTCYFNSGYIQETVTKWNPPFFMGLNIDRTHMPGRHWLGFESAEYDLRTSGSSTIVTRTTVVSSHLLPRWYWRPFERLGVGSEHKYILQDLLIKTAP